MRTEEEEEEIPRGGYLRRSSLVFFVFTFDLLASIAADTALPDISQYRYDVQSSDGLLHLEQDLEFQLHLSPGDFLSLDRRRRFAIEPGIVDPISSHEQTPEPSSVQEVLQTQQPDNITKSDLSLNVSYSTADQKAITTLATPVVSSTTSPPYTTKTSTGLDAGASSGPTAKGVIVSTPIVPSTDKSNATKPTSTNVTNTTKTTQSSDEKLEKPKIKVWANQTLWSNVTDSKNMEPSETDVDDFTIDKYTAEVTNKTLHDNNITKSETDTHQYYNSTFSVDESIGKRYWVNLKNHPDLQINTLLSKSHRRAATIKLKFDFPFYGHKVRNITIATGGFLYTGEYVHSWLAATQYIAPLMANFDTTLSSKSFVKYADNGTAFTVEWENVHLQDKPEAGAFTFQVTLLQNGDIIFVYSVIPVLVENIQDKEHPVKIGLSDAYMMDRTVFFARRKTIYEYHRVSFNRQDIKNWTAIYLNALPTCLQADNCNDCLTKIKDFECKWCPELQKCSTGTFRFRQEWLHKGCDIRYIKEEGKCPARSTIYHEHVDARAEDQRTGDMPEFSRSQQVAGPASSSLEHDHDNINMGVSGIIGILFVVSLIAGIGAWAAYAYRNPHSASGQMLIRYRPSQWSWRRGEARYTAATIHM